jgi:quercetin dioxygenase-like cupin family protein
MVSNNISTATFSVQLRELIDYAKPGVTRKALVKDEKNQFSLMCLTAGTTIPEHAALRPVSITVIEGWGSLTLEGQEIALEPGVFVYIPAQVQHALSASENLAFLHT